MKNIPNVIAQLKEAKRLVEECLSELETVPSARVKPSREHAMGATTSLDLGMPLRAFMKRYAKGLSGPKKFALVLARLAGGDKSKSVGLSSIENEWNKMTSILGGRFNHFYSNQARERDWVATTKAGAYHLRPSWREALR